MAEDVIGYCTGYVDEAKANLWFNAVPSISHPIMGRERPFTKNRDIATFVVIAKTSDQEIRSYLAKRLSENFPSFFTSASEGKGNAAYFAIMLGTRDKKLLPYSTMLALVGYSQGLREYVQNKFRRECELTPDYMTAR